MPAATFPPTPAAPTAWECDPLRRIDFTCEEAGRELVSVAAAQRLLLPARLPELPGLDLAVASDRGRRPVRVGRPSEAPKGRLGFCVLRRPRPSLSMSCRDGRGFYLEEYRP